MTTASSTATEPLSAKVFCYKCNRWVLPSETSRITDSRGRSKRVCLRCQAGRKQALQAGSNQASSTA